MDILQDFAELKANHESLSALFEASKAELTKASASIADKDSLLSEAKEALKVKDADLDALKGSLEAELHTAKARIAELETSAKTAEEKAIELVARQGIAPLKVDSKAGNSLTKEEALEEYGELLKSNSLDAGKFYAANKAVILS